MPWYQSSLISPTAGPALHILEKFFYCTPPRCGRWYLRHQARKLVTITILNHPSNNLRQLIKRTARVLTALDRSPQLRRISTPREQMSMSFSWLLSEHTLGIPNHTPFLEPISCGKSAQDSHPLYEGPPRYGMLEPNDFGPRNWGVRIRKSIPCRLYRRGKSM